MFLNKSIKKKAEIITVYFGTMPGGTNIRLALLLLLFDDTSAKSAVLELVNLNINKFFFKKLFFKDNFQ